MPSIRALEGKRYLKVSVFIDDVARSAHAPDELRVILANAVKTRGFADLAVVDKDAP